MSECKTGMVLVNIQLLKSVNENLNKWKTILDEYLQNVDSDNYESLLNTCSTVADEMESVMNDIESILK